MKLIEILNKTKLDTDIVLMGCARVIKDNNKYDDTIIITKVSTLLLNNFIKYQVLNVMSIFTLKGILHIRIDNSRLI